MCEIRNRKYLVQALQHSGISGKGGGGQETVVVGVYTYMYQSVLLYVVSPLHDHTRVVILPRNHRPIAREGYMAIGGRRVVGGVGVEVALCGGKVMKPPHVLLVVEVVVGDAGW